MASYELRPSQPNVYKWVLSTIKHSIRVEYYLKMFEKLNKYNLKFPYVERPHDLVGLGNKLELDSIRGFASQWCEPDIEKNPHLKKAIENHRLQDHHQKFSWNGKEVSPDISDIDAWLGAFDVIASLGEPREYSGGIHTTWEELTEAVSNNPPYKKKWLINAIDFMKTVPKPDLDSIISLSYIPNNLGLDQNVYREIIRRKDETVEMLKEHGYNLDGEKYLA